ncbi:Transcription factor lepE [Fusarium oxysporum f. sp. albedinis]|nr:Transcription factor lepE [Fusarium oxysporum f. sp. albedinis]
MSDPSLLCIQHSLRNNDSPVHSQAQEKDTLSKCMPIKEHEPAQAGGPASNPVSVGDKSEHRTDKHSLKSCMTWNLIGDIDHAECHKEKINQPPSIREDRNGPECDSEFCEEDETTESPTTSTSDSAARDGVYTSLFEFNRIPSAHRLSLRAHRTQGKVQRVSLLTGRTRRPLRKIQKRLSKESKPLQKVCCLRSVLCYSKVFLGQHHYGTNVIGGISKQVSRYGW